MSSRITNQPLPVLYTGSTAKDQRGEVSFINDFIFPKNIARFYTVKNHKQFAIRAWHGHKKEAKYVFTLSGNVFFGLVYIDNWRNPSKNLQAYTFYLNGRKPSILYIPPGYVNGFQSLTKNAKLLFYSTASLQESLHDDIRFDKTMWNIWKAT